MEPDSRIASRDDYAALVRSPVGPSPVFPTYAPCVRRAWIGYCEQRSVFVVPRDGDNLLARGPRENSDAKRVLWLREPKRRSDFPPRGAPNKTSDLSSTVNCC